MNDKIEAIRREGEAAAAREQEIIRQINANSAKMTAEEIKALDAERQACVAKRREARSAINVLGGLGRKLNPTAKAALQAALALVSDTKGEASA
jgi:hypothetical protein